MILLSILISEISACDFRYQKTTNKPNYALRRNERKIGWRPRQGVRNYPQTQKGAPAVQECLTKSNLCK